MSTEIGKF